MGKKGDLSGSERAMFVGAKQADQRIWETAYLLGFSCTTMSREKENSQWAAAALWAKITCWSRRSEENSQTALKL